jgi:hypothetical protein
MAPHLTIVNMRRFITTSLTGLAGLRAILSVRHSSKHGIRPIAPGPDAPDLVAARSEVAPGERQCQTEPRERGQQQPENAVSPM